MDDVFKALETKLADLTSKVLADKSQLFDVENAFPAILTKEELKRMLGCGSAEVERYINSKNFPVIRGKGKQDRFPRDAVRDYLRFNWENIA